MALTYNLEGSLPNKMIKIEGNTLTDFIENIFLERKNGSFVVIAKAEIKQIIAYLPYEIRIELHRFEFYHLPYIENLPTLRETKLEQMLQVIPMSNQMAKSF